MRTREERKAMQERAHALIEKSRLLTGWYERETAKEIADRVIAKAKVQSEIARRLP